MIETNLHHRFVSVTGIVTGKPVNDGSGCHCQEGTFNTGHEEDRSSLL